MNLYAGTYNGQVLMLSGHPTNIEVKRRNQISQTSIRSLYLPPGSAELLSGGFDGELIAINKFNLQSTKQTKQPHGMINCIEKINEHIVALGHQNGLIRFWDWKAWNLKKQIRQHKKAVRSFAIDNNEVLFFSAANNNLILWNTQKQEKVFNFKFDYEIEHVLIDQSLEFIILINQKEIHQIKTKNNEQVASFKIKTAEMIQSAIIFQNYVLIGGDKGNVSIYALGQYQHKIHFQAHKLRVKSMKTIKYDDIDYLITASSSGQIAVWDVLQFLKQVDKIGQDYQLTGLQPLCSVNLDKRIICLEVGLLQTKNTQQVETKQKQQSKAQTGQKVKNKNKNRQQKKSGKKLPAPVQVQQKEQIQQKTSPAVQSKANKEKRILKKKKKMQKKLQQQKNKQN